MANSSIYLNGKELVTGSGSGDSIPDNTVNWCNNNVSMVPGSSISLTAGASNTQYTAPANGYYQFYYIATQIGDYSAATTTSLPYEINSIVASPGNHASITVPVKKGDIVKIHYSDLSGVAQKHLRFIYANNAS